MISGAVSDAEDLPNAAEHVNELWVIAANQHGELWISDGTNWMYAGTLQGPQGQPGAHGLPGPRGPQGIPGPAPQIGNNGNWFVWDANTLAYVDTGVHAQGEPGPQGPPGQSGLQDFSFMYKRHIIGNISTQESLCEFPMIAGKSYFITYYTMPNPDADAVITLYSSVTGTMSLYVGDMYTYDSYPATESGPLQFYINAVTNNENKEFDVTVLILEV